MYFSVGKDVRLAPKLSRLGTASIVVSIIAFQINLRAAGVTVWVLNRNARETEKLICSLNKYSLYSAVLLHNHDK